MIGITMDEVQDSLLYLETVEKNKTKAKNLMKLGILEWQARAASNCRKSY